MKPRVSVLLPVYNGQRFLAESINSVLIQSFKNFELIIIDDGSTDKSLQIIKRFAAADQRIVFKSRPNVGLSATLNEAIKMTKATYIARQDADDVSDPKRLEKQLLYMDANPDVYLLGTNYHVINEAGGVLKTTDVLTQLADLKLAEIFSNQFGHGSVMIRKSVLKNSGGFNLRYKIAQDYDLWLRISRQGQIANLKEPLYRWRSVGEGLYTNPANVEELKQELDLIRAGAFAYFEKHKADFRFIYFKPDSINGGLGEYLKKKNTIFRDMALMYSRSGYGRRAVLPLLVSLVYRPWSTKSYRQLRCLFFERDRLKSWTIENV